MAKIDRLGWAAGLATIAYGHRIGIRVSDAAFLPRVEACLPPGSRVAARPQVHCMYSLVVGGSGAKARRFNLLYRGTERIARSHDLDEVCETLRADLESHVAAVSPSRVFLHAGVVGWRGRAIVLPGRTCSGKSTLVAELVRSGAAYYSDEYAVLDARGRVHPFARPLQLRARADGSGAVERIGPQGLRTGRRPLPVGLIALTHYQAGAEWRSREQTPGLALLSLVENALPVRQRPEATLRTLRELVTGASVIEGVRGEAADAVAPLLDALRAARSSEDETKVSSGSRGRRQSSRSRGSRKTMGRSGRLERARERR